MTDNVTPIRLLTEEKHPDANVQDRYLLVQEATSEYLNILDATCPPGREHALARTNVEQAALWALAAITRDRRSGGTG